MTEKDYSLLRPFDLEAAKAGAKVCWHEDGEVAVDVMFVRDRVIPLFEMCFSEEQAAVFTHDDSRRYLRAAPLCWVEGKPVYPGDVLWQTTLAGDVLKRKAKQISADGSYLEFEETGSWAMDGSVSKLSWAEPPPKPVKRWINVYPGMYRDGGPCSTTMHSTKEAADDDLMHGSIACIEIELPPIKP